MLHIIVCFLALLFTYYSISFNNHYIFHAIIIDIIFALYFIFILIKKKLLYKKISKIHKQTIVFFTLASLIPSIFTFLFNAVFINKSIESWFKDPVKMSIESSKKIADAYLHENSDNIKLQAQYITRLFRMELLNRFHHHIEQHQQEIEQIINMIASHYNISDFIIFNESGNLIAKSHFALSFYFDKINLNDFEQVKNTDDVHIIIFEDRIRGLFRLDMQGKYFVLIGRYIPKNILENLSISKKAHLRFAILQAQKKSFELNFTLIMFIVSFLILLIAIWFAFEFSNRFMIPVDNLLTVAKKVQQNNWEERVIEPKEKNELHQFIHTFNKMLDKIYKQHNDLKYEKYINEAVIQHVPTIIICFNKKGEILLMNKLAENFFNKTSKIKNLPPEIHFLFNKFMKNEKTISEKLVLPTQNGFRTFKILISIFEDQYILTLSDVTDILMSQKYASWNDMARKIAHEIKNPLTPIQLSAERLKKRFSKQIHTDANIFQDSIDIIIRQVQSIFSLIKQLTIFSDRLQLSFETIDLIDLGQKLITFYQESLPHIQFECTTSQETVMFSCDSNQMQQVLVNLINNSVAILEEHHIKNPHIILSINQNMISLEDNGPGFPENILENITKPYITLRKGGTGLGLAIVEKIIHDHNGEIMFLKSSLLKGAKIQITFSKGSTHA